MLLLDTLRRARACLVRALAASFSSADAFRTLDDRRLKDMGLYRYKGEILPIDKS